MLCQVLFGILYTLKLLISQGFTILQITRCYMPINSGVKWKQQLHECNGLNIFVLFYIVREIAMEFYFIMPRMSNNFS